MVPKLGVGASMLPEVIEDATVEMATVGMEATHEENKGCKYAGLLYSRFVAWSL
jgi:hypothetical protein